MWFVMMGLAAAGGAYDVLKLRDGGDCAALGTGPEARDELIALAEGDVGPPYVPIRAAECLVQGFAADATVVEHARTWVADPEKAGLGIIVAGEIDAFSVEDGVSIARAAVAGTDPKMRERLIRRFMRSERIEVRKVVEGVDAGGGGR
ncbi:MAG: hypothetical protein Q8P41_02495 [Pseudomonadota bacterium]|nr:hypothetical protein [Pseudomonadota bacterium]